MAEPSHASETDKLRAEIERLNAENEDLRRTEAALRFRLIARCEDIEQLKEGLHAVRYAVAFIHSPQSEWAAASIANHFLWPDSQRLSEDAQLMVQKVREDAGRDAAWLREHPEERT